MNTTLAVPPKARRYVYGIVGAVSLAVGSAQVGYASLGLEAPDWLTVALAVVPFVAAGVNYTAVTHTPSSQAVETYVGDHRVPESDHYVPDVELDQPDPIVDSRGVSWPNRS